jgi:hypothetical protein
VTDPPRIAAVSDGCILRILEGLMTLQIKGGTRDRLSYRALDVEQIGSVYETVMGFTVEVTAARSLAIRAGKNNHTPVFVNLEELSAAKGKDRIKFLKEEADRTQLSANVSRAVEGAKNAAELAVALDPIVDERGSPKKHETPTGTPILQPTDERRRTGSHYTPRSLTEPIVRYALEPTFERLGTQATPQQILDLKVCDPAMGSGAFLVEACRALAVRLTDAWARHPDKKPTIPPDEDEELHARRLVAQRCLYGVDKNPLATDLAKLSLWLATLARDHEFSFLDHALKSGDSLVGLTQTQIAAAHWDTSKAGLPLFRQLVKERVVEAMKGRAEIQAAPDDTTRATQEQRHKSLEARLKEIRLMGNAVIAAFFAEDKPKPREKKRAEVESWLGGSPVAWDKLAAMAATLQHVAHPLTPFHWEIEFPEVFVREKCGFDAVVGNPPFLGGKRISTELGDIYAEWIFQEHVGSNKNMDLVGHFVRRAFDVLREGGRFGLVTTNTIRQGDTRQGCLVPIMLNGGSIARALRRLAWRGEAAVIVSILHINKGFVSEPVLDNHHAGRISAYLLDAAYDGSPEPLHANSNRAFIGAILLGMGFTFDDTDKKGVASSIADKDRMIAKHPELASRIFPYIGGEELNNDPRQRYHRFAFNISALTQDEARLRFPELYELARLKVKPQRDGLKRPVYRDNWWRFGEPQTALASRLSQLNFTLAISRVSTQFGLARLETGPIFADSTVVFLFDHFAGFATLQARPHELWARFLSSSMKDDLRYAPSDCFETFPFPVGFETSPALETAGHAYHEHRAALMVARNEGMTKTYNRFHDSGETAEDIQRLRDLHAAMDRAMLEAYGWHNLATRAAPVFLDETNEDDHTYQDRLFWSSDFRDEVLARLLALNAERHAEEVRLGTAPGMRGPDQIDEGGEDID